ncbi:unnamed protein product [Rodentolepis nana]|uniref:lysoplasmalogenase n=1 Tax=Rodentolepis nana TaxID=102285 RepID=A0A0R3T3S2_RODNA|nr:unnamed protein product [Rodentolepis nana]
MLTSAMAQVFQDKINLFLKLLRRTFITTQKLHSTSFRENSDSYVILTKNRPHLTNWPDTKLGPIDAINPKYPLPGYVGLVEKDKKCEVALIPAASNLPVPSTHHYASVLSQAEYSIEEFVDAHSLVPTLDPTLEHVVHSCPEIIKSDLSILYPTKDFSGSRLTSISFHYSLKSSKDAENFEDVYELFVQSALDVCASLNQMGYWADFMHPKTGIPYIGFHLQPYSDARLTNFGFYVNANGCCKVNRERLRNQRLFVGILFTDAPKDHPAGCIVIVTVPFIFSSVLYLKYFIESSSKFEKCAFKCAPIVWLTTFVGIIRYYVVSKSYATFISIGLLFCIIGDICLVYDIKELFLSGMITFAICHASYTMAYGFKPPHFSLSFPIIIAFLTLNYHFAPALRGLFVYAIPAYSFILFVMIWRAVSLALETSSYSLALGSILFGLSDTLIGINKFLTPLEHSHYTIMATYYLGQLGIAISTLSIGSKQKIN